MEGGIKILGRDSGEIMRSMFCLVSNMSDWSTASQQKEGPERDHWNHRKAWLRMQYPRKWAAVWETKVMKMLWKKTQCKPLADQVRDPFKMGGVIWRPTKTPMHVYGIWRKPLKSLGWGTRLRWAAKGHKALSTTSGTNREGEGTTMIIGRKKLAFQVGLSPASPLFFFFFPEKGIVWLFINPNLKIKRTCSRASLCWNVPLSSSSGVYFFLTRSWECSYGTSHSK